MHTRARPPLWSSAASLVPTRTNAYSPLAADCLASHLQKCTGVEDDRHALFLRSIPEPTIAVAGRIEIQNAGWTSIFQRLNERGIADIDVGAQVGAQCLLSDRDESSGRCGSYDDFPIFPITLHSFVSELLCFFKAENVTELIVFENWTAFLQRAYIRVIQFTKSYSELTPEFLKGRFCRSNGVMCPPGTKGIDGLMPLLIADKPLLTEHDMRTVELKNFSHVGLQFKNHMDFKGPAACKKKSTEEMRADIVLGAAAHSRDPHLPYVSLLLDVGPPQKGEPEIWFFESDGCKHIVKTEDAADLDLAFARFFRASRDPVAEVQSNLSHSQGDLYCVRRTHYLEQQSGSLVERYHTVKQFAISRSHGLPTELEATFQSCQTYVDIFKCNKVFGPKDFKAFYLLLRKFEMFIRDSLEDSSRAKRYQYTPSF